MPFALTCTLAANAMPSLKALRGDHLAYIRAHLDKILVGGPARGPDGAPQEMIILLRTHDRGEAEAFIAAEPYNASCNVFSKVELRPWSQVVPETSPGTLDQAIEAERAKASS